MIDKVILAALGIIALLFVLVVLSGACAFCGLISTIPGPQYGWEGPTDYREDAGSHAVADNVTIDVYTFNGNVELMETNGSNIDVKVKIRAPEGRLDEIDSDIRFTGTNDTLNLNVEVNKDFTGLTGRYGADVYVYMPENAMYELNLMTSNGRITVGEFNGSSLVAGTSNGAVDILGGSYGILDVSTSNGAINAKYDSGDADFKTSNGAIDIDTKQSLGRLEATTSNGRISIRMPENASFSIDADTSNGYIDHEMPLTVTFNRDSHIIGYTEGFTTGLEIYLRTSNGNIRIMY
ncbi:hypothetical protein CUJ83_06495 [Methanocella sp. CWC-04]|uniref:DUF4097 domain-containing protein n=1 Tax=Methanooceanicella nereidis TaxID=2052831 RepID=A0AAP2REE2_9EURY|nr:DUF4097 family beta strand repeat-containing protein [Methanocella sp. CWC-04]MCD1294647.1 hypothetical protein [Methanocella sp. CWC-04]